MIYLKNIQGMQIVELPRTMATSGQLSLAIKGTLTHETIFSANVTDSGISEGYFNFNIGLPGGIQEGEYEYTLSQGDDIITSGVLVIGEYAGGATQYNNSEMKYEQYGD